MLPHTGILTSHKIHTWIWNRRQSGIVWYTITSSTSNYTHRNQSNVGREQFISEIACLEVRFVYNIPNLRLLRPVCLHYPTIALISWLASGTQGKGVGEYRVLWCQKCYLWSGSWFMGGLNYHGNFTWQQKELTEKGWTNILHLHSQCEHECYYPMT